MLQNVDIDQGIHKGKMKVALNEKRKKLRGFSFSINVANFEAFLLVFKLTKNLFFLKSVTRNNPQVNVNKPHCFIFYLLDNLYFVNLEIRNLSSNPS